MRDFYLSYELPLFQKARTFSGFLDGVGTRILAVLFFYLGPVLMLPLMALRRTLRDRRRRFLVLAGAIFFVGLLASAFTAVHYLAPATALIFAIVVGAARRLRAWRPGGQPVGRFLVRALPCMCLALLLVQVGWIAANPTTDPPRTQVRQFPGEAAWPAVGCCEVWRRARRFSRMGLQRCRYRRLPGDLGSRYERR